MAERITKHGAICVAALKKFPKTPILTLAKKLYSENPLHFKNIEHARKLLSYHSGKSGKRNRKRQLDKSMQQEVLYNYAPFENIPESFEEIREP